MARYITLGITVSPVALLQRAYGFLKNLMPSWNAAEGGLDTWLLESSTTEISELVAILSAVPDIIFQYFGSSLMALPPTATSAAVGHTTWFLNDTNGHFIPAGTQVAIRNSIGDLVPFLTVNDVTVMPGANQTLDGGVTISALQSGFAGNGLSGTVELLDILDFVASIVTTDTTSGGVDAETDDDYMSRLVNLLQLLTLTPVLPDDFVILARTIPPAYRVTALDLYNPVTDTYGNPRMITMVSVDSAGEAVDIATRNAIKAKLQSVREVNFIVNTMDPTYTTINVTTTVVALPDVDKPTLQSNVVAGIQNFLSPANWGIPKQGTSTDPRDWINTTILRKYDLSQAIHAVSGVRTIVPPLLLGKTGDPLTENDVTLNGRASLPRAGIINVTVI